MTAILTAGLTTSGAAAAQVGTAPLAAAPSPAAQTSGSAFLSVVIGRAMMAKASQCTVPAGMMTLDQVVPQLASMGVHVTANVIPDRTAETTTKCVKGTLYPSWTDLGQLRDQYGLTAVSATQSYANLTILPVDQQFTQTCGSLATLIAHGDHRAWGYLAYPDNRSTAQIQTDVTQECFAYGRVYAKPQSSPTTNSQSGMAPPWFQVTVDAVGGHCSDRTLPCSASTQNRTPYSPPPVIAQLMKVAPGTWTAVQFYSFVTGSSLSGAIQWDCSSPNWQAHWTSQAEMYCWSDLVSALQQRPAGVVITDPATVAEAWGRIPTPVLTVDSAVPTTISTRTQSTTITWHAHENGTYQVLVGGSDCGSGQQVDVGTYSGAPATTSVIVSGSALSPGQNTERICLTNDAGHTGSAAVTVTYTGT